VLPVFLATYSRALPQIPGDSTIGYKVAWSDRMVSMYTGLPLAAVRQEPLRHRLRPGNFAYNGPACNSRTCI